MLIDGKILAEGVLKNLQVRVQNLSFQPRLIDVVVESDPVQMQYARSKKKAAESIGVHCQIHPLPEAITSEGLREILQKMNVAQINGLLVQLPLPYYIDVAHVLDVINPSIDVDCLTSFCKASFYKGDPIFVPPTAQGVLYMLESLGISLASKNILVLGQGELVGKPTAQVLRNKGLIVETADKYTPDIQDKIKQADVLIAATGQPGLITGDICKPGSIIIDAGTSEQAGEVVGDVEVETVREVASFLSPVPGGLGPLTVAMLLQNVIVSAEKLPHK